MPDLDFSSDSKAPNAKLQRKAARFKEEIEAVGKLQKDDVSKFALVNEKTLRELKIVASSKSHLLTEHFAQDETPAEQRALYKLATEPVIVKASPFMVFRF